MTGISVDHLSAAHADLYDWWVKHRVPQPDGIDQEKIAQVLENARGHVDDALAELANGVADLTPQPECTCRGHYHGGPDEGGRFNCPTHGEAARARMEVV